MAHHRQSHLAQEHHADPAAVPLARAEPLRAGLAISSANYLSNRVFDDYNAIIDAACEAWRNLLAQPHTITSIGMRTWGA